MFRQYSKINEFGQTLNFNWCGYLKPFKQCGELIKFILCCYLVKINYLGSKVKINKCGHQVKLNLCGYLVNFKHPTQVLPSFVFSLLTTTYVPQLGPRFFFCWGLFCYWRASFFQFVSLSGPCRMSLGPYLFFFIVAGICLRAVGAFSFL